MKTITSLLFLISFTTFSFGQTEKLNQFDEKGKKDGKWTVYLNERWNVTKDRSKAVYFHYVYYDHGTVLTPYDSGSDLNPPIHGFFGKLRSENIDKDLQKGKPKLMDGEYKWVDKKGRVRLVLVLKQGEFISYRFFSDSGKMAQYSDYSKKWKGQPHTYFMSYYGKKGKIINGFCRFEGGYWMDWIDGNIDSTSVDTLKTIGDSSFVTSSYYTNGKIRSKSDEILVHVSDLRTKTILNGNCAVYGKDEKWEGQLHYGKLNGEMKSYYLNGQLKASASYFEGKKVGEWKYWDEKGNLTKTENYK